MTLPSVEGTESKPESWQAELTLSPYSVLTLVMIGINRFIIKFNKLKTTL
jgi:hypothetical protein